MWGRWLVNLTLVFLLVISGFGSPAPQAAEFDLAACRFNLGLRLAYGHHVKSPPVPLYTLLPRWGVFLVRPHGSWPGGLGLSFEVEGIISVAEAERSTGWEIGFTPLLKLTLPVTRGLHLFIEGGAGIIGENFESEAIPHRFNFTPQVGGGLDIALTSKLGLTLAYRYRHSSNAGLYRENPAFNVQFFQAGVVYFY